MSVAFEQRDHYAQAVCPWDAYRDPPNSVLERWIGEMVQLCELRPDSTALDIGCGTTQLTIPLKRLSGAEVYGLDLSAQMLRQAQQKESIVEIPLTQGDARRLPFPDNTFDFTLMSMVLQHIDDIDQVIGEMARVLRVGGRSLIWTLSHRQIDRFFLNDYFPSLPCIDGQRFPEITTLKSHLKKKKFRSISIRTIHCESELTVQDLIEKVEHKFISTLDLISSNEFTQGLESLKNQGFSSAIQRRQEYTWICGHLA